MYSNADIQAMANTIYGEMAGKDVDHMVMVGSTILNRLDSQKFDEFGGSIPEVIQKGYYAAKNNTDLYQQAVTQKFPDKNSENKFKQALSVASGLAKGTIKRQDGQFYFKDNEIANLKKERVKTGKGFNFKAVKEHGKVGAFRTFGY
jgi:spore germination cell wall hydrolase CwlJ-like protein